MQDVIEYHRYRGTNLGEIEDVITIKGEKLTFSANENFVIISDVSGTVGHIHLRPGDYIFLLKGYQHQSSVDHCSR